MVPPKVTEGHVTPKGLARVCACATGSWGFPPFFSRVFRPELTLPVGVSSGARMRNRKLAYPPFFRVFFHFYFFFFFFFFFLFFIPFFLFLFIYLLFSFFFSFFFLNTRKRNVSITSHK